MSTLKQIIESVNRYKYHIEYQGFLSNHMLHGLVALDRIDATPERLQDFARVYSEDLEPPRKDEGEVTDENLMSWRGKRKGFVQLSEYFVKQLQLKGRKSTIAHVLPHVIEGIHGAAFHPIIQLGYSLEADHDDSVAEGLAYLVFNYRPLSTIFVADDGVERGPPLRALKGEGKEKLETQLVDALRELRKDKRVQNVMTKAEITQVQKQHGIGEYQSRMILCGQRRGDILREYAQRLPYLQNDEHYQSEQSVQELLPVVLRQVIEAYSSTEPDFFMLHGVTSFWSLGHVLPYLPSVEWQRYALFVHAQALLCTYLAQGSPKMVKLSQEKLPPVSATWDEVLKRAVQDNDEHLIKLVFTCHRLMQTAGDKDGLLLRTAAVKVGLLSWPQFAPASSL